MPRQKPTDYGIDLKGTGIDDSESDKYGSDGAAFCESDGKATVCIFNQAGYDGTVLNVERLLEWLKTNRPEILMRAGLQPAPPT